MFDSTCDHKLSTILIWHVDLSIIFSRIMIFYIFSTTIYFATINLTQDRTQPNSKDNSCQIRSALQENWYYSYSQFSLYYFNPLVSRCIYRFRVVYRNISVNVLSQLVSLRSVSLSLSN